MNIPYESFYQNYFNKILKNNLPIYKSKFNENKK